VTKILAGNWKMHKTRDEVKSFFAAIKSEKLDDPNIEQILAPSPTLMECAVGEARGTRIQIFSQNCAWEKSGALTGEMSPLQLKELDVVGTLVGHSERRQYFGESDSSCEKRARAALESGLRVIYCIGESLDERKAGQTRKVLETQLAPLFRLPLSGPMATGLPAQDAFVLAYEPVWAIGTGVTAEPEQVREAHGWIAEMLNSRGLKLKILYGGSVKPNNFQELASLPHVAGGLVGGASLEAASYIALFRALAQARA
jgi:triosephosphate isomerase